jgi:cytochrome c-type biogenesis protein CcmH
MILWLTFALMTAVAVLSVLWPFIRRAGTMRSGSDLEVYRDQLDEIDRDRAVGLISKPEAEAARVEVSRRLLAAADAAQIAASTSEASSVAWHRLAVVVVALLLLPVSSVSLYLRLGSPGIASQPIASRSSVPSEPTASQSINTPSQQSIESMIARAETRLQRNPKDGRVWDALARLYMHAGRDEESVTAWQNALSFLGENADREEGLGESLLAIANGIVTADAKAAFNRAVAIDGNAVAARFYLGLAAEQEGKRDEAAIIWRKLIATAPAGAPWVEMVRDALSRVE